MTLEEAVNMYHTEWYCIYHKQITKLIKSADEMDIGYIEKIMDWQEEALEDSLEAHKRAFLLELFIMFYDRQEKIKNLPPIEESETERDKVYFKTVKECLVLFSQAKKLKQEFTKG